MTELNRRQLRRITEKGQLLDNVESDLQNDGYRSKALALNKFQQDAGVQFYIRDEEPRDNNYSAPGEITAQLNANYQPVTTERLNKLANELNQHLSAKNKALFSQLLQEIRLGTGNEISKDTPISTLQND